MDTEERLKLDMDNAVKALKIAQACMERALARMRGKPKLRVVK